MGSSKVRNFELEVTLKVMRDGRPATVEVAADGAGLVSGARSGLGAGRRSAGADGGVSVRLTGSSSGVVVMTWALIRDLAVVLADGVVRIRPRRGSPAGSVVRAGGVRLDRRVAMHHPGSDDVAYVLRPDGTATGSPVLEDGVSWAG